MPEYSCERLGNVVRNRPSPPVWQRREAAADARLAETLSFLNAALLSWRLDSSNAFPKTSGRCISEPADYRPLWVRPDRSRPTK